MEKLTNSIFIDRSQYFAFRLITNKYLLCCESYNSLQKLGQVAHSFK